MIINEIVANIDITPPLLDMVGIPIAKNMDGRSLKHLLEGKKINWRKELLYEYYWEQNYPYTPTTHALISDKYNRILSGMNKMKIYIPVLHYFLHITPT